MEHGLDDGAELDPRLRAFCDLTVPTVREYAGLHRYDGVVADLSPEGVRAGLARLGGDSPDADQAYDDAYDAAALRAAEAGLRVAFGEAELHRRNVLVHLANLDLSCYDRDYAPAADRAAARRRHLAAWPDGVDAALASLDAMPAPVADALIEPVRGLAAAVLPDDGAVGDAALAAHARLLSRVEDLAATGDPDPALGARLLARLIGVPEGLSVDLGALAARAERERDRMRELLTEACAVLRPGLPVAEAVAELARDHPTGEGVLAEARELTAEVLEFTAARQLAPWTDGECRVGPAPESRRWATAMMTWAAPYERDAASWYHVTPPDPSWPVEDQEEWLAVFSRTSLPAITAHEVAPGHYAHGRALRHVTSPVRRVVFSEAFVEGWAHYAEELCLEEGFRAGDARFAAGVAIEALVRVTRLTCAIGLHTQAMDVDEATRRFVVDAYLQGPAARSEAVRGTFDPTYGRYTWGKLALLDLRELARRRWGAAYTHLRFASAMLDLGAPPLGLLDTALDRG